MKKNGKYYVNQHSSFLLKYQMVLISKDRKEIFQNEELKKKLLDYTKNYFADRNIDIVEMDMGNNYFHVHFNAGPNNDLSKVVNAYKSASSRVFRRVYSDYLKKYDENSFWSMCYFIGCVDAESNELAKMYIQDKNIM